MQTQSGETSPAAADEAAMLGVLLWLGSDEFGKKVREVLANPNAQTTDEISKSIGFPPLIFRALHAHYARAAREPRAEPPTAPVGGKAQLDAIAEVSPLDAALSEVVRRFASVSFANKAASVATRQSARTVEEIAALLGLQTASIQIEVGARLAELTGAPVEVPLGEAGNGAVMKFRPAVVRTHQ